MHHKRRQSFECWCIFFCLFFIRKYYADCSFLSYFCKSLSILSPYFNTNIESNLLFDMPCISFAFERNTSTSFEIEKLTFLHIKSALPYFFDIEQRRTQGEISKTRRRLFNCHFNYDTLYHKTSEKVNAFCFTFFKV